MVTKKKEDVTDKQEENECVKTTVSLKERGKAESRVCDIRLLKTQVLAQAYHVVFVW